MTDEVIQLRAKILEVVRVYSNAIGAVPFEMLVHHVNNLEKIPYEYQRYGIEIQKLERKFDEEEIMKQVQVLEDMKEIEQTKAWKGEIRE